MSKSIAREQAGTEFCWNWLSDNISIKFAEDHRGFLILVTLQMNDRQDQGKCTFITFYEIIKPFLPYEFLNGNYPRVVLEMFIKPHTARKFTSGGFKL